MPNLVYRGVAYQRQSSTINSSFSPYTAKYRGCSYKVTTLVEDKSASHSKLTYRGCQVF